MFYRPPLEWEEEQCCLKANIFMFLLWQTSNKIYFKLVEIKSKQTIDQSNSLSSGTFEEHRSPLIIHYMVNIDDWLCIITAIDYHYITEQWRTIEYIGSVDYHFIIDASHHDLLHTECGR